MKSKIISNKKRYLIAALKYVESNIKELVYDIFEEEREYYKKWFLWIHRFGFPILGMEMMNLQTCSMMEEFYATH